MRIRRAVMSVVATACAGCAHAVPAAPVGSAPGYAVEVENATGLAVTLGYCGLQTCGDLGRLERGATRRFAIAALEGPEGVLFGKEGDRWVARQRVELRQGAGTRVKLVPLAP